MIRGGTPHYYSFTEIRKVQTRKKLESENSYRSTTGNWRIDSAISFQNLLSGECLCHLKGCKLHWRVLN